MAIGDKIKGLFVQPDTPKQPWMLNVPEEPEPDSGPSLGAFPSSASIPKSVTFADTKGKWTNDVKEMYAKSSEAEALKNENSIYKLRQLIETLPKDLGKSVIQGALRGILDATGIPVANLERDAAIRKNVITGYLRTSNTEMDARSKELSQSIVDAEQRIEAAKQELADIRAARSNVEQTVEDEMKNINDLLSFLVLDQR